jgi:CRISPR-associated endonuclease/helicase Cas3
MQPSTQVSSLKALARPNQRLLAHSLGVGHHAAVLCSQLPTWTRLLGLLHDYGKYRPEWVTGIDAIARGEQSGKLPLHAVEGAMYLMRAFPDPRVRLLALLIASHHGELPDIKAGIDWMMGNDPQKTLPILDDNRWSIDHRYQQEVKKLIGAVDLQKLNEFIVLKDYRTAQRLRFVYGAIVAADRQDAAKNNKQNRWKPAKHLDLLTLADRLASWYDRTFPPTQNSHIAPHTLNELRRDFYEECRRAASHKPGWLSVRGPCGISKTWSVMQMALDHAAKWNKKKVIYCVPWTAILEQSYEQYWKVLGKKSVLGHWSTLLDEGGKGSEDPKKLRNSRQWWDTPIVATTMVQLFDILLCNKSRTAQRMPSLQDAVIILDEVQGLPTQLIMTCIKVLDQLVQDYGATIILATATMPDYTVLGIDPLPALPSEKVDRYFAGTERVNYEWRKDPLSWLYLVEQIKSSQKPSTLIVVNTVAACDDLYQLMESMENYRIFKYTASMSPAHRSEVLKTIKQAIDDAAKGGLPIIVCGTSAIETGVDADFSQGFRELAGLESIVQFAGRINRNLKEKFLSPVVIFKTVQKYSPPPGYDNRISRTEAAMNLETNLQSSEVLTHYSKLLFQDVLESDRSTKIYNYIKGLEDLNWQEVSKNWEMIAPTTSVLIDPRLWGASEQIVSEFDRAIAAANFRVLQRHCVGLYREKYRKSEKSKKIVDGRITGLKEWVGDYNMGIIAP